MVFGFAYNYHLYYHGWNSVNLDGFIAAIRIIALDRRWLYDEFAIKLSDGAERLIISSIATLQIALTALLLTMLVFSVRRRFKH